MCSSVVQVVVGAVVVLLAVLVALVAAAAVAAVALVLVGPVVRVCGCFGVALAHVGRKGEGLATEPET